LLAVTARTSRYHGYGVLQIQPKLLACRMQGGLHKTERVLAESRNRAVLPMLAAALSSHDADIRAAAIRATMRRRDVDSHTQLLHHVDRFDETDLTVLENCFHAMQHHAAPALKAALAPGDGSLCHNACRLIEVCHVYAQFPTLVKALEHPRQLHAPQIASTIEFLATALHGELEKWARGDRNRTDPTFARHQLLATAAKSLTNAKNAPEQELVDAFLMLAPNDHAALHQIMGAASHPCHATVATTLATSNAPVVMDRLVEFLRDTAAPSAILEIIAERTDSEFVTELFQSLKYPVPLRALQNMKQLKSVGWLESRREILLELDGRAQAIAVELAMASGISRNSQFELLKLLLQNGLAEGRRASCQALAQFSTPAATQLVLGALTDPDAAVQAAALRQLRSRHVPNALAILVARLNSPHLEIRDAARSSLAEFNFARYRAMFDLLDDDAVRTTGILVRQVDPTTRQKLVEELTAPSISARLRGIEMALAMEATLDVCEQLIELACHENVALRKEAVTALGEASGPQVIAALTIATRDTNRSVAEAANRSLARQSTEVGAPP
jgi:hypothetical protein